MTRPKLQLCCFYQLSLFLQKQNNSTTNGYNLEWLITGI
jgi:hypothetical protein